jgi:hypothetical protein
MFSVAHVYGGRRLSSNVLVDELTYVELTRQERDSLARSDGRHAGVQRAEGVPTNLQSRSCHRGHAKRDDRGGTLDIHALRTTFATLLSKGVWHRALHKRPCGISTFG